MRRLAALFVLALTFPALADTIDTLAGNGKAGFTGDGGKALDATLNQPFHCELDGKGGLLVAEAFNHCVRRIDLKTGTVSTVAGTGKKGFSGDGGPARDATFNEPYAVVVSPEGDLYIADRLNASVRKVDAKSGSVSTVAGTGKKGATNMPDNGQANATSLVEPNDVCLDGKGGLLIADVADWRVRRVDLKTGVLTTFAGVGKMAGKIDRQKIGDGGPAAMAVVVGARAVCADGKGNVYICEREGNAVRKVDAAGTITTVAGTGAKGAQDGKGGEATFNGPKAIRCDAAGNVYVVDTENHSIRKIDGKTGEVTTVAGGQKGTGGDGGDARKAEMDRPHGVVVGPDGTLYIADSNNHRVRRVKLGK